jgi:hypothetical protein
MSQHFPFSERDISLAERFPDLSASLRWYRLTFASTLLPPSSEWRHAGEVFRMSVGWASQILFHLSASASMNPMNLNTPAADISLEPDSGIVEILSFAIDHYYVVV